MNWEDGGVVTRQSLADQVATELRAKIDSEFATGQQLPPEIELASQMQVSRATLREAIGTLWKEGLVDRRWGVGTFVRDAAPPVVASLTEATPTRDLISAGGHEAALTLASIEQVEAEPEIASSLGIVPDAPIWRIERIFAVDGTPMSYQVDYLPTAIGGKPVDPVPLKSIDNDVITLLKNVTGKSAVVFDVRVEAVACDRSGGGGARRSGGLPGDQTSASRAGQERVGHPDRRSLRAFGFESAQAHQTRLSAPPHGYYMNATFVGNPFVART